MVPMPYQQQPIQHTTVDSNPVPKESLPYQQPIQRMMNSILNPAPEESIPHQQPIQTTMSSILNPVVECSMLDCPRKGILDNAFRVHCKRHTYDPVEVKRKRDLYESILFYCAPCDKHFKRSAFAKHVKKKH